MTLFDLLLDEAPVVRIGFGREVFLPTQQIFLPALLLGEELIPGTLFFPGERADDRHLIGVEIDLDVIGVGDRIRQPGDAMDAAALKLVFRCCQTNANSSLYALPMGSFRRRRARATLRERRRG